MRKERVIKKFTALLVAAIYLQVNVAWAGIPSMPLLQSAHRVTDQFLREINTVFLTPSKRLLSHEPVSFSRLFITHLWRFMWPGRPREDGKKEWIVFHRNQNQFASAIPAPASPASGTGTSIEELLRRIADQQRQQQAQQQKQQAQGAQTPTTQSTPPPPTSQSDPSEKSADIALSDQQVASLTPKEARSNEDIAEAIAAIVIDKLGLNPGAGAQMKDTYMDLLAKADANGFDTIKSDLRNLNDIVSPLGLALDIVQDTSGSNHLQVQKEVTPEEALRLGYSQQEVDAFKEIVTLPTGTNVHVKNMVTLTRPVPSASDRLGETRSQRVGDVVLSTLRMNLTEIKKRYDQLPNQGNVRFSDFINLTMAHEMGNAALNEMNPQALANLKPEQRAVLQEFFAAFSELTFTYDQNNPERDSTVRLGALTRVLVDVGQARSTSARKEGADLVVRALLLHLADKVPGLKVRSVGAGNQATTNQLTDFVKQLNPVQLKTFFQEAMAKGVEEKLGIKLGRQTPLDFAQADHIGTPVLLDANPAKNTEKIEALFPGIEHAGLELGRAAIQPFRVNGAQQMRVLAYTKNVGGRNEPVSVYRSAVNGTVWLQYETTAKGAEALGAKPKAVAVLMDLVKARGHTVNALIVYKSDKGDSHLLVRDSNREILADPGNQATRHVSGNVLNLPGKFDDFVQSKPVAVQEKEIKSKRDLRLLGYHGSLKDVNPRTMRGSARFVRDVNGLRFEGKMTWETAAGMRYTAQAKPDGSFRLTTEAIGSFGRDVVVELQYAGSVLVGKTTFHVGDKAVFENGELTYFEAKKGAIVHEVVARQAQGGRGRGNRANDIQKPRGGIGQFIVRQGAKQTTFEMIDGKVRMTEIRNIVSDTVISRLAADGKTMVRATPDTSLQLARGAMENRFEVLGGPIFGARGQVQVNVNTLHKKGDIRFLRLGGKGGGAPRLNDPRHIDQGVRYDIQKGTVRKIAMYDGAKMAAVMDLSGTFQQLASQNRRGVVYTSGNKILARSIDEIKVNYVDQSGHALSREGHPFVRVFADATESEVRQLAQLGVVNSFPVPLLKGARIKPGAHVTIREGRVTSAKVEFEFVKDGHPTGSMAKLIRNDKESFLSMTAGDQTAFNWGGMTVTLPAGAQDIRMDLNGNFLKKGGSYEHVDGVQVENNFYRARLTYNSAKHELQVDRVRFKNGPKTTFNGQAVKVHSAGAQIIGGRVYLKLENAVSFTDQTLVLSDRQKIKTDYTAYFVTFDFEGRKSVSADIKVVKELVTVNFKGGGNGLTTPGAQTRNIVLQQDGDVHKVRTTFTPQKGKDAFVAGLITETRDSKGNVVQMAQLNPFSGKMTNVLVGTKGVELAGRHLREGIRIDRSAKGFEFRSEDRNTSLVDRDGRTYHFSPGSRMALGRGGELKFKEGEIRRRGFENEAAIRAYLGLDERNLSLRVLEVSEEKLTSAGTTVIAAGRVRWETAQVIHEQLADGSDLLMTAGMKFETTGDLLNGPIKKISQSGHLHLERGSDDLAKVNRGLRQVLSDGLEVTDIRRATIDVGDNGKRKETKAKIHFNVTSGGGWMNVRPSGRAVEASPDAEFYASDFNFSDLQRISGTVTLKGAPKGTVKSGEGAEGVITQQRVMIFDAKNKRGRLEKPEVVNVTGRAGGSLKLNPEQVDSPVLLFQTDAEGTWVEGKFSPAEGTSVGTKVSVKTQISNHQQRPSQWSIRNGTRDSKFERTITYEVVETDDGPRLKTSPEYRYTTDKKQILVGRPVAVVNQAGVREKKIRYVEETGVEGPPSPAPLSFSFGGITGTLRDGEISFDSHQLRMARDDHREITLITDGGIETGRFQNSKYDRTSLLLVPTQARTIYESHRVGGDNRVVEGGTIFKEGRAVSPQFDVYPDEGDVHPAIQEGGKLKFLEPTLTRFQYDGNTVHITADGITTELSHDSRAIGSTVVAIQTQRFLEGTIEEISGSSQVSNEAGGRQDIQYSGTRALKVVQKAWGARDRVRYVFTSDERGANKFVIGAGTEFSEEEGRVVPIQGRLIGRGGTDRILVGSVRHVGTLKLPPGQGGGESERVQSMVEGNNLILRKGVVYINKGAGEKEASLKFRPGTIFINVDGEGNVQQELELTPFKQLLRDGSFAPLLRVGKGTKGELVRETFKKVDGLEQRLTNMKKEGKTLTLGVVDANFRPFGTYIHSENREDRKIQIITVTDRQEDQQGKITVWTEEIYGPDDDNRDGFTLVKHKFHERTYQTRLGKTVAVGIRTLLMDTKNPGQHKISDYGEKPYVSIDGHSIDLTNRTGDDLLFEVEDGLKKGKGFTRAKLTDLIARAYGAGTKRIVDSIPTFGFSGGKDANFDRLKRNGEVDRQFWGAFHRLKGRGAFEPGNAAADFDPGDLDQFLESWNTISAGRFTRLSEGLEDSLRVTSWELFGMTALDAVINFVPLLVTTLDVVEDSSSVGNWAWLGADVALTALTLGVGKLFQGGYKVGELGITMVKLGEAAGRAEVAGEVAGKSVMGMRALAGAGRWALRASGQAVRGIEWVGNGVVRGGLRVGSGVKKVVPEGILRVLEWSNKAGNSGVFSGKTGAVLKGLVKGLDYKLRKDVFFAAQEFSGTLSDPKASWSDVGESGYNVVKAVFYAEIGRVANVLGNLGVFGKVSEALSKGAGPLNGLAVQVLSSGGALGVVNYVSHVVENKGDFFSFASGKAFVSGAVAGIVALVLYKGIGAKIEGSVGKWAASQGQGSRVYRGAKWLASVGVMVATRAFIGSTSNLVRAYLTRGRVELKDVAKGAFWGILGGGAIEAVSNWGRAAQAMVKIGSHDEFTLARIKSGFQMAVFETFINTPLIRPLSHKIGVDRLLKSLFGFTGPPPSRDPPISLLSLTQTFTSTFFNIAALHPFFSLGRIGSNPVTAGLSSITRGLERRGMDILNRGLQGEVAPALWRRALGVSLVASASLLQPLIILPATIKTFEVFEKAALLGGIKAGVIGVKETDGNKQWTQEGEPVYSTQWDAVKGKIVRTLGFLNAPIHAPVSPQMEFAQSKLGKARVRFLDVFGTAKRRAKGRSRRQAAENFADRILNEGDDFKLDVGERSFEFKTSAENNELQQLQGAALSTLLENRPDLAGVTARAEVGEETLLAVGGSTTRQIDGPRENESERGEFAPIERESVEVTSTLKDEKGDDITPNQHEARVGGEKSKSSSHVHIRTVHNSQKVEIEVEGKIGEKPVVDLSKLTVSVDPQGNVTVQPREDKTLTEAELDSTFSITIGVRLSRSNGKFENLSFHVSGRLRDFQGKEKKLPAPEGSDHFSLENIRKVVINASPMDAKQARQTLVDHQAGRQPRDQDVQAARRFFGLKDGETLLILSPEAIHQAQAHFVASQRRKDLKGIIQNARGQYTQNVRALAGARLQGNPNVYALMKSAAGLVDDETFVRIGLEKGAVERQKGVFVVRGATGENLSDEVQESLPDSIKKLSGDGLKGLQITLGDSAGVRARGRQGEDVIDLLKHGVPDSQASAPEAAGSELNYLKGAAEAGQGGIERGSSQQPATKSNSIGDVADKIINTEESYTVDFSLAGKNKGQVTITPETRGSPLEIVVSPTAEVQVRGAAVEMAQASDSESQEFVQLENQTDGESGDQKTFVKRRVKGRAELGGIVTRVREWFGGKRLFDFKLDSQGKLSDFRVQGEDISLGKLRSAQARRREATSKEQDQQGTQSSQVEGEADQLISSLSPEAKNFFEELVRRVDREGCSSCALEYTDRALIDKAWLAMFSEFIEQSGNPGNEAMREQFAEERMAKEVNQNQNVQTKNVATRAEEAAGRFSKKHMSRESQMATELARILSDPNQLGKAGEAEQSWSKARLAYQDRVIELMLDPKITSIKKLKRDKELRRKGAAFLEASGLNDSYKRIMDDAGLAIANIQKNTATIPDEHQEFLEGGVRSIRATMKEVERLKGKKDIDVLEKIDELKSLTQFMGLMGARELDQAKRDKLEAGIDNVSNKDAQGVLQKIFNDSENHIDSPETGDKAKGFFTKVYDQFKSLQEAYKLDSDENQNRLSTMMKKETTPEARDEIIRAMFSGAEKSKLDVAQRLALETALLERFITEKGIEIDKTFTGRQQLLLIQFMLGRIAGLEASGGKTAVFILGLGDIALQSKSSDFVMEMMVFKPQEVNKYLGEYGQLFRALGMQAVDGIRLNDDKVRAEDAFDPTTARTGYVKVVVSDLHSRGFLELDLRREPNSMLAKRVAKSVNAIALDEVDALLLSRMSFISSDGTLVATSQQIARGKKIVKAILDVFKAGTHKFNERIRWAKDSNKAGFRDLNIDPEKPKEEVDNLLAELLREGKGWYTRDLSGDIRVSDGLLKELRDKLKDVDPQDPIRDYEVVQAIRAFDAVQSKDDFEFSAEDGGSTVRRPTHKREGELQKGQIDSSVTFNVTAVLFENQGRVNRGEEELPTDNIRLSEAGAMATIVQVLQRGIHRFGATGTPESLKGLAELAVGLRVVDVDPSTYRDFKGHLANSIEDVYKTDRSSRDKEITFLDRESQKQGIGELATDAIGRSLQEGAAILVGSGQEKDLIDTLLALMRKADPKDAQAVIGELHLGRGIGAIVHEAKEIASRDSYQDLSEVLGRIDVIDGLGDAEGVANNAAARQRVVLATRVGLRALNYKSDGDLRMDLFLSSTELLSAEAQLQAFNRVDRGSSLGARRIVVMDRQLLMNRAEKAVEIDEVLHKKFGRRGGLFGNNSGAQHDLNVKLGRIKSSIQNESEVDLSDLVEVVSSFRSIEERAESALFFIDEQTTSKLAKEPIQDMIARQEGSGGKKFLQKLYRDILSHSDKREYKQGREFQDPITIAAEAFKGGAEFAFGVMKQIADNHAVDPSIRLEAVERMADILESVHGVYDRLGDKDADGFHSDQAYDDPTFIKVGQRGRDRPARMVAKVIVQLSDFLLPHTRLGTTPAGPKNAPQRATGTTEGDGSSATDGETYVGPDVGKKGTQLGDSSTRAGASKPAEAPFAPGGQLLSYREQAVAVVVQIFRKKDEKELEADVGRLRDIGFISTKEASSNLEGDTSSDDSNKDQNIEKLAVEIVDGWVKAGGRADNFDLVGILAVASDLKKLAPSGTAFKPREVLRLVLASDRTEEMAKVLDGKFKEQEQEQKQEQKTDISSPMAKLMAEVKSLKNRQRDLQARQMTRPTGGIRAVWPMVKFAFWMIFNGMIRNPQRKLDKLAKTNAGESKGPITRWFGRSIGQLSGKTNPDKDFIVSMVAFLSGGKRRARLADGDRKPLREFLDKLFVMDRVENPEKPEAVKFTPPSDLLSRMSVKDLMTIALSRDPMDALQQFVKNKGNWWFLRPLSDQTKKKFQTVGKMGPGMAILVGSVLAPHLGALAMPLAGTLLILSFVAGVVGGGVESDQKGGGALQGMGNFIKGQKGTIFLSIGSMFLLSALGIMWQDGGFSLGAFSQVGAHWIRGGAVLANALTGSWVVKKMGMLGVIALGQGILAKAIAKPVGKLSDRLNLGVNARRALSAMRVAKTDLASVAVSALEKTKEDARSEVEAAYESDPELLKMEAKLKGLEQARQNADESDNPQIARTSAVVAEQRGKIEKALQAKIAARKETLKGGINGATLNRLITHIEKDWGVRKFDRAEVLRLAFLFEGFSEERANLIVELYSQEYTAGRHDTAKEVLSARLISNGTSPEKATALANEVYRPFLEVYWGMEGTEEEKAEILRKVLTSRGFQSGDVDVIVSFYLNYLTEFDALGTFSLSTLKNEKNNPGLLIKIARFEQEHKDRDITSKAIRDWEGWEDPESVAVGNLAASRLGGKSDQHLAHEYYAERELTEDEIELMDSIFQKREEVQKDVQDRAPPREESRGTPAEEASASPRNHVKEIAGHLRDHTVSRYFSEGIDVDSPLGKALSGVQASHKETLDGVVRRLRRAGVNEENIHRVVIAIYKNKSFKPVQEVIDDLRNSTQEQKEKDAFNEAEFDLRWFYYDETVVGMNGIQNGQPLNVEEMVLMDQVTNVAKPVGDKTPWDQLQGRSGESLWSHKFLRYQVLALMGLKGRVRIYTGTESAKRGSEKWMIEVIGRNEEGRRKPTPQVEMTGPVWADRYDSQYKDVEPSLTIRMKDGAGSAIVITWESNPTTKDNTIKSMEARPSGDETLQARKRGQEWEAYVRPSEEGKNDPILIGDIDGATRIRFVTPTKEDEDAKPVGPEIIVPEGLGRSKTNDTEGPSPTQPDSGQVEPQDPTSRPDSTEDISVETPISSPRERREPVRTVGDAEKTLKKVKGRWFSPVSRFLRLVDKNRPDPSVSGRVRREKTKARVNFFSEKIDGLVKEGLLVQEGALKMKDAHVVVLRKAGGVHAIWILQPDGKFRMVSSNGKDESVEFRGNLPRANYYRFKTPESKGGFLRKSFTKVSAGLAGMASMVRRAAPATVALVLGLGVVWAVGEMDVNATTTNVAQAIAFLPMLITGFKEPETKVRAGSAKSQVTADEVDGFIRAEAPGGRVYYLHPDVFGKKFNGEERLLVRLVETRQEDVDGEKKKIVIIKSGEPLRTIRLDQTVHHESPALRAMFLAFNRIASADPEEAVRGVEGVLADREVGDLARQVDVTPLLERTKRDIPLALRSRFVGADGAVRETNLRDIEQLSDLGDEDGAIGEFKRFVYQLLASNADAFSTQESITTTPETVEKILINQGDSTVQQIEGGRQVPEPSLHDRLAAQRWNHARRQYGLFHRRPKTPSEAVPLILSNERPGEVALFGAGTLLTIKDNGEVTDRSDQASPDVHRRPVNIVETELSPGWMVTLWSLLSKTKERLFGLWSRERSIKEKKNSLFVEGEENLVKELHSVMVALQSRKMNPTERMRVWSMVQDLARANDSRPDPNLLARANNQVGLNLNDLIDRLREANGSVKELLNRGLFPYAAEGLHSEFLRVAAIPSPANGKGTAETSYILSQLMKQGFIRLMTPEEAVRKAEELSARIKKSSWASLTEPLLAILGPVGILAARKERASRGKGVYLTVGEMVGVVREPAQWGQLRPEEKAVFLEVLIAGFGRAMVEEFQFLRDDKKILRILDGLKIRVVPQAELAPNIFGRRAAIDLQTGMITIGMDPNLPAKEAFADAMGKAAHEVGHAVTAYVLDAYGIEPQGLPTTMVESIVYNIVSNTLRRLGLNPVADVVDLATAREVAKTAERKLVVAYYGDLEEKGILTGWVQEAEKEYSESKGRNIFVIVAKDEAEKNSMDEGIRRGRVPVVTIEEIHKRRSTLNETALERYARLEWSSTQVLMVVSEKHLNVVRSVISLLDGTQKRRISFRNSLAQIFRVEFVKLIQSQA